MERHQELAGRAPLTVAVTGATGLIGSALVDFLRAGGHSVRRLRRGAADPAAGDVTWDPNAGVLDPRALEGVDAVVHLAGESVADRWSKTRKREILRSRELGTRLIAETMARMARRPSLLVSASASGYYGSRGDEPLDESSPPGRGFLADVTRAWEAAADPARAAGIRVVHPRLAVVLSPRGGVLERILPPFRLGIGGKLGDGKHWFSWIGLDDLVGILHFLLLGPPLDGPVNATAPAPVTNAEFGHALGHVLHRPAVATIPKFAVELVLGREQTEEMAFASQRMYPRALEAAGFRWRHPAIEDALRHELAAG
jgi:uncharacterized protein (TIGR01777 family)